MLLWVSAVKYLELINLTLGFGAPEDLRMSICPLNMQISLIVASIFLSTLSIVQFCCALNMMLLCVSVIIVPELMALSLKLRGPWGR